jgi:hypothetical protein
MVDIDVQITASAPSGPPSVELLSVTSNEPDDVPDSGDGTTTGDIQPDGAGLALRAERDGSGDGRIYTITYQATTSNGTNLITTASTVVVVPHAQGMPIEPLTVLVSREADGAVLSWNEIPSAIEYDVVRGRLAAIVDRGNRIELGEVVCIQSDSTAASTAGSADADVPVSGEVYFYTVQYTDWQGSSSYGTESARKPRQPTIGDCNE